jgi:hypothetical protein
MILHCCMCVGASERLHQLLASGYVLFLLAPDGHVHCWTLSHPAPECPRVLACMLCRGSGSLSLV